MTETETKRQEAVEQLAAIEQEAAKSLDALHAATCTAKASVEELAALLMQAKQDYLVSELAELNAHNRFQALLAPHRAYLEQTAPTILKQFLNELRGSMSRLRGRSVVTPPLPRHPKDQADALNARWQEQQALVEYHDLLRSTADAIGALLYDAIDPIEASREIMVKRQQIQMAQAMAQRAGVNLN